MLLRAMASDNPRKALDFLQTSHFEGSLATAESVIFSSWLKKDLNGALDYLASNAALRADSKGTYYPELLQALSQSTPKELDRLLARLPDDDFKFQLLTQYANQFVSRGHYAQAVSVLNDLPDSKQRDQSLLSLGRTWGAHNPRALADWLNLQPSSIDRDLVTVGFAGHLAQTDQQAALQWANSIPDAYLQTIALKQIAFSWMSKDREAGTAWLQSSSLAASDQEDVLRHIREGNHFFPIIDLPNRR